MSVKCIAIDNACIMDELVELETFTLEAGYKIVQDLELNNAGISMRGNVMVIAHEDGQFILVRLYEERYA